MDLFSATQTEDTPEGFHTSLFECKAQADNIKKTLIDENIEAKSKSSRAIKCLVILMYEKCYLNILNITVYHPSRLNTLL